VLAVVEVTRWHYIAFIGAVLVFVALDLFVFHRKTHTITFKNALLWTSITVVLALMFWGWIWWSYGRNAGNEFIAGYIIELSLSMDNVFVIALIFGYFRVPSAYQHRVLFFGFIDALIMRGLMIAIGVAIVRQFHWVLYVLGAFLVFSGLKMLFSQEEGVHPERNPVIRLAQRLFPVASQYDGARFFTRINGRFALTPLAIVLLMVETTDLIFAIDSIPAIFVVTQDAYIIFTSNIFAILGLRSLYFVLVGMIEYFRYLKYGLALVLVFVGAKMFSEIWHLEMSTGTSLRIVLGILAVSIISSVIAARLEKKTHRPTTDGPGPTEPPATGQP
jgi:tellurite resistance protein TerC